MSKVTILTKPNRIVIASKGVQGVPGPRGLQGDQGIQGPKGDTGDVTPEALAARDAAQEAASVASTAASTATGAASAASGSASAAAASANLAEQARLLGASIGFATKADMDASLAHPDGTLALVTNDPTAENNGAYRKTGASGSGSWVQSADRVTGLEGRVYAIESEPASERVARIATAMPNYFSRARLEFEEMPVVVSGTWMATRLNGIPVVHGLTNASGVGRALWRFREIGPDMQSAGVVSAAIVVEAGDAGTASGSSFKIVFKNASLATISTEIRAFGAAAITQPTVFRIENIAIPTGAIGMDIEVEFRNASGDMVRNFYVRSMVLVAGASSYYRDPITNYAQTNLFPDPAMVGAGAVRFEATSAVEDGLLTMSLTPGGELAYNTYIIRGDLVAPGEVIEFTSEVYASATGSNTADVTWLFFNAAGAEISRNRVNVTGTANTWIYYTNRATVPAGTATVELRITKWASATTFKLRNIRITSSAARAHDVYPLAAVVGTIPTVYVNPAVGSDANIGSPLAPVASITAAMNICGPSGRIILASGTYARPGTLAGMKYVEIIAAEHAVPIIRQGTTLAGITKTSGYSNVYEAPGAATSLPWLFWHGQPSGAIDIAEAHPLHNGRTHRLPHTRLVNVASIADVEASSVPAWHHTGGKFYFSLAGAGDALAAEIVVPSGASPFGGGDGTQVVVVSGLVSMYSGGYGFDFRHMASVTLRHCVSLGSGADGIKLDDTADANLSRCEAASAANDGINQHSVFSARHESRYIGIDNWCHDCFDDGQSLHEYCIGTNIGGLWEHNADRGTAPAAGASETYYGGVTRYNGGEGIGALPTATDGGRGTTVRAEGMESYGNRWNYRVFGDADQTLTLFQCVSRDPSDAHFAAQNGALIVAHDCSYVGSGTVKLELSGGAVVVRNTEPLT